MSQTTKSKSSYWGEFTYDHRVDRSTSMGLIKVQRQFSSKTNNIEHAILHHATKTGAKDWKIIEEPNESNTQV